MFCQHVCLEPRAQKSGLDPCNWTYGWLLAATWVLRTNSSFSAQTTNAPNCQAISPTPRYLFI